MGAGSYSAGSAPAGSSPTPPIAGARNQAPAAIEFDPQTRSHPRDDDGRYVERHPVDAAVVYALHFEFGSVYAVPTQGRRLKDIRNPTDRRTKRIVEDRVRRALLRLVRNKDITITKIRHESPNRGALFVEVSYYNERIFPRALRGPIRVTA